MKSTEEQKQYMKDYYQKNLEKRRKEIKENHKKNKDKYNAARRLKYKNNPEPYKEASRIRRLDPQYKKWNEKYMKDYWEKNKSHLLEANKIRSRKWYASLDKKEYRAKKRIWERNKMQTDIRFRIKKRIRLRLRSIIINKKVEHLYDEEYHLDYKPIIDKLILELPKDFAPNKYHIDHITPLFTFDLTKHEELEKAFAPENHQWLTVEEHRIKSASELRGLNYY